MAKHVFLHLCNELKRLHLLEEDTGIISVQESIGILLYILGHNADMRFTGNRFQHSLETIQRRFRRALQAIHSLGCLIIRPNQDVAELPHHLRGNTKYYPRFEAHTILSIRGQDLEPGNASISGGARVGGGGNEEAFSP
nr:hypothetical protein CFP56_03584 [Quercus suber]